MSYFVCNLFPDNTGSDSHLVRQSSSVGGQLQYRWMVVLWSGVWGTIDHESDPQENKEKF